MTGFFQGLSAPLRGMRVLLANPSLWPLVVAPACITTTLLGLGCFGAAGWAAPFTRWLLPELTHPALRALGTGAAFVLLGVLLGGLAWMLASLLAIPVLDRLSERIEGMHRDLPAPLSMREALPRSIRHSIAGFLLWVTIQVLLLPLNLLPGVGSMLEFAIGMSASAFLLAHQLMDGALSRQAMGFVEKLRWLSHRPGPVLGLGAAGLLMVAVPGVNLIGLPIALVGGTLLYVELTGGRQGTGPAEAGRPAPAG